LRQLAHKLSALDPDSDPIRQKTESEVLDKLWRMGILKQSREQGAGLSKIEREVTVSAFCRRRLAVVMARSGMVENIKTVRAPFISSLLSLSFISRFVGR
jgi:U3 small nucleolar ribonucleoprotein protein IMP3